MPSFDGAFGDMLPEEALFTTGLRILAYISESGENKYTFRWSGAAQVTEIVGLLELVKAELLTRAINSQGTSDG